MITDEIFKSLENNNQTSKEQNHFNEQDSFLITYGDSITRKKDNSSGRT